MALQRIGAAAARIGCRRAVFAHVQIVVEKGKMRRGNNFDHFIPRLEGGISAVLFRGGSGNKLPGTHEWQLFFSGLVAGKQGCKQE